MIVLVCIVIKIFTKIMQDNNLLQVSMYHCLRVGDGCILDFCVVPTVTIYQIPFSHVDY